MIDTSELVEKYNNGDSLAKLGRQYNLDPRTVKRILQENGIKIRSQKEQNKYSPQNQRVYNINDMYFSVQSPNMAYLLGFIAADGCIYEKTNVIKIALSSTDNSFLLKIKEELQSESPIMHYQTKDGYNVSELKFSSFQIKKDLADYNIIPRKTYNFKFPMKLKKEYYKDFIRGYFDGDGSVSTAGKEAIRWQLISHEKDILNHILNYFEEFGIPKVSIYTDHNNNYYIQYSTTATKHIYDILYYDNCFCLDRKYNKYRDLLK